MATSSNPVRVDAKAARDAVVNGQRDEADAAARFAALGGASGAHFELRRDGVAVGACALTLSRSARNITVAQNGAWSFVAAADKDTGTWVSRIVNASDPTRYLEFSITSEQTISADLIDNGVGQLNGFVVQTPAYDTSVTAFPVASDLRTMVFIDASKTFANQPAAVSGGYGGRDCNPQISFRWLVNAPEVDGYSGRYLYQIPESGAVNNDFIGLIREDDPVNGAPRKAFKHRIASTADIIVNTARSAYLAGNTFRHDTTYWYAFACRWPAYPGRFVTIFDVHENTWDNGPYGRPPRESQSPIQLQMGTDGKYRWQTAGCYIADYERSQVTRTFSSYSSAVGANDWHYWVVKARVTQSAGAGPLLECYHAVNGGASSLEHSISAGTALGINDSLANNLYPKLGLYQFELNGSAPSETVMHTKGLFVFRDEAGTPTLSVDALLALMRSV